jgi:hypothetical protein
LQAERHRLAVDQRTLENMNLGEVGISSFEARSQRVAG